MMYQFLRLEQIKHIKIKAGLRTDGKHLKRPPSSEKITAVVDQKTGCLGNLILLTFSCVNNCVNDGLRDVPVLLG